MKKKVKGLPQTQNQINQRFLIMLDEAIPVDQEGRRKYVGDIAFFYGSTFKQKLQHFRGLQLEELARYGVDERTSDFIRSNINVINLIDDWMQKMFNEHEGNLHGIRDALGSDEEFIREINKKYG
jgi:hypothetical protein